MPPTTEELADARPATVLPSHNQAGWGIKRNRIANLIRGREPPTPIVDFRLIVPVFVEGRSGKTPVNQPSLSVAAAVFQSDQCGFFRLTKMRTS